MAQHVTIVLIDDLDQSEAAETVSFALDGKDYIIDLSTANAATFRDALSRYVGLGRPSERRWAGVRASRATHGLSDAGVVRDWARTNGHVVSTRGRLSTEVNAAYDAAH
jgi:hypothetical protein